MADTKITNLTAKTTVVDADEIVINDAGTDKKIGLDDLKTFTSLSPTFITPALGTPASGVLTNATGLPTAGLVDDAVTLGKMASGTDGNLISYDTSGNPAAVATGTSAQVLTSNGAGAAPTFQAAGGGGGFSVVYKTADETITSDNTLSDDADLQFSVDASSYYVGFLITVHTSEATPDYKHAFTVPSGATVEWLGGADFWSANNTGYIRLDATSSISILGTGLHMTPIFIKTDTTAGTCNYQWAQNNSDAGNTTLNEGAFIMFKKVS